MGRQPYRPVATAASRLRRRDRWLLTTGWLVLGTVCLRAGFWQLDRAAEKQAALDDFASAANVAPRSALVSDVDASASRYQSFRLTGRYNPEQQILLDNMVAEGVNGYQVLTPFRTNGQWVLVNRGWLPAPADRQQLPDVSVSPAEREITGVLNRLPEPGMRLAGSAEETLDTSWPRRLLFPTRETLSAALDRELPDYQLLLTPGQPDGYRRDWSVTTMGPATHYGYALQWFSFAALTTIFYALLLWRGRRSSHSSTADGPKP